MKKSDSIANIAAALSAMQAEIGNATKGATNPHFKSKYADLSEVLEVAKDALPRHGLSFAQFPTECAGGIVGLTTILMHKSGEWLQGTASTPIAKQDPQGVGSAITYLRRYSLKSVLGIGDEDDDGNSASTPAKQSPPKKQPAPDVQTNAPAVTDAQLSRVRGLINAKGINGKTAIAIEKALRTGLRSFEDTINYLNSLHSVSAGQGIQVLPA